MLYRACEDHWWGYCSMGGDHLRIIGGDYARWVGIMEIIGGDYGWGSLEDHWWGLLDGWGSLEDHWCSMGGDHSRIIGGDCSMGGDHSRFIGGNRSRIICNGVDVLHVPLPQDLSIACAFQFLRVYRSISIGAFEDPDVHSRRAPQFST